MPVLPMRVLFDGEQLRSDCLDALDDRPFGRPFSNRSCVGMTQGQKRPQSQKDSAQPAETTPAVPCQILIRW